MQRWVLVGIAIAMLVVGVARWSRDGRLAPVRAKLPPVFHEETRVRAGAELESPVLPPAATTRVDPAEQSAGDEGEPAAGQPAEARRPVTRGPVAVFQHAPHDHRFEEAGRWLLYVGLTDAGAAFADNEISHVDIPPGLQVTLFDDPGGRGARVVLGPGQHGMSPLGFNDRASSVLVAPEGSIPPGHEGPRDRILLYEHGHPSDEPGLRWALRLKKDQTTRLFRASEGDFSDNAASAAWVPPGFELTLFDASGGRGWALVVGPGLHDLAGMRWNDRTSSARVRRLDAQ
ncbi:MAG: hypothetical protein GY711_25960 [bacterium]|nr:hypothetical protein [bacterium]